MGNRVAIVVAAMLGCTVAVAQDDVDVTLQVLDDVTEVEGVILSIEGESAEASDDAGEGDERTEESAPRDREEPGEATEEELDREDDGEGSVEDFDVPEVVEPEEPEAPEELEEPDA